MKNGKWSAPDYLDDRATEIYENTLPELAVPVSHSDHLMLAAFAQASSDWERLTATIHHEGDTMPDQNGVPHKHHLGIPQAKAFDIKTKAWASLGLERKQRVKAASPSKRQAKAVSLRKAPRKTGTDN